MKGKPIPAVNAKLCRLAGALAVGTGIGVLLIASVMWLTPAFADSVARAAIDNQLQQITLTLQVRLMCLSVVLLHELVLLWGLWTMRALFMRLGAGAAFEIQTGELLRRFGLAILIYAGLFPVERVLTTFFLTMYNPTGKQLVGTGIGETEVVLALIGALLLVLGSVLADAARMADENRQFI